MNKRILLLVCIIASTNLVYSQYVLKNTEDIEWYSNIAQEEIYVHHNANVLFSGERLFYKVYCKNSKTKAFTKNSKIAYVELLDAQGTVFKHKIRLENGIGQGDFFIPASISSGNYKLISYTQWMKNGVGNHFFQTDITIINPYAKINFDDNATEAENALVLNKNTSNSIELITDSDTYGKREEVTLNINATDAFNAFGEYSISVRKVDDLPLNSNQYSATDIDQLYSNSDVSKPRRIGETMLLPEFRGEMITGRITDNSGNNAVHKVEVALSILSDEAYQDIVLTNNDGVFYFQLVNQYSTSDALVQVVGDARKNYSIELFDHESANTSNLEFKEFKIHSKYKDQIVQRSVYNQIQNAYSSVKKDQIELPKYPEPFYGNYMQTFALDDYKRFADVAETLIEIVDHAWHERENGKTRYINVRERENDPYWGVDLLPMVVVDGALVQDHESILYYDADNVESISVLRDEYYYGDRVYQGAVLIKTFDKNYAENLTDDYVKAFTMFSPELKTNYFEQSYLNESDSNRIPDYRSQLFWNPRFKLQRKSEKIKFFTSDNKGTYLVSIEGFTNNGKPISIKKSIVVK